MASKQLSAAQVRNAKPTDKEFLLADGDGLFLRVRPSGAREWIHVYSFAGRRPKIALGSLDVVSLADARLHADKIRTMLAQGLDPQLERKRHEAAQIAERQLIEAHAARLTLAALFERWHSVELSRRKDSGLEVRRCFAKDVIPALGAMPIEDITRGQIAELLDTVAKRGARIVARNLLGDLRQMYGYAIKRGFCENDPTSHLKRDDFGRKVERSRVLSEAEVRSLAQLLPMAGMQESSVHAIWALLATGARVGEISSARLADIDLAAGVWVIPAENAKNAKEHRVYLSTFAKAHIGALIERAERLGAKWLLPAKNPNGSGSRWGAVCSKSLSKQIGDRQRGEDEKPMKGRSPHITALELPGGRWTAHDLRRTAATLMGALGVRPDVIEKCLNHVEQNRLVRIYQRQQLVEEQCAAWALLGDRLALLTRTDASNVVTIRAA